MRGTMTEIQSFSKIVTCYAGECLLFFLKYALFCVKSDQFWFCLHGHSEISPNEVCHLLRFVELYSAYCAR